MKRSRTSEMWQYFTILDKEFAKCDLCQKKFSYRSTTSNLKKHLQTRHVHVSLSSNRPLEPDLSQTTPAEELPEEVTLGTCSVENEQAVAATSKQQAVQSKIPSFVPKRIGVNQKKKIDKELLKLFTRDYQPFSVVEDSGLRSVFHALNPSYDIPSRKYVANVLLEGAYTACEKKVKEKLLNVKTVCLTTDCWTSAANESYMAVTGHFISENFTLESVLLGCAHLSGSHTASNLSKFLEDVTNKFKLTGKILLVVTDNAANIKSAVVSVLNWKHFGCYAHTLNLIVQDALKNFVEIHQKVKNIVGFFKRSSQATEKLMNYQRMNSGISNAKKLIQDVPTRWNYTLFMLERIVELQDAVKSSLALSNTDVETLSTEEWNICLELCTVLKPFQEVSTQLGAESYPTGSQVIVLTRGLLAVCDELLKRPFNKLTETIVKALSNGLKKRFQNVEMSRTMGVATLLDPRFKTLAFEDNTAAESAKQYLVSLVAQKQGDTGTNVHQSHVPVAPASTTDDSLSVWGAFQNVVRRTQPQGTPQSRAIVEVQRYLDSQIIGRSEDPLTWWRENQYIFPNITKVMKERFNVVATSVPCERIFSKAGLLINDRRTRLKPSKVEKLVFLNKNDIDN